MSKTEISRSIRTWVRDILPSLNGTYTLKELYLHLSGLYNDQDQWDTIYTRRGIGDYMVRMEVLRSRRIHDNVTRVTPGVYCFN